MHVVKEMAETGEKNDLPTIADDLVVTKYKMSADIVNSKLFLTYLPICRQYEVILKLHAASVLLDYRLLCTSVSNLLIILT